MDYKRLKELEGCINDESEEFPAELDSLIADTARTGIVRLPWGLLKPLFNYRPKKVEKVTQSNNYTEKEQVLNQKKKEEKRLDAIPEVNKIMQDLGSCFSQYEQCRGDHRQIISELASMLSSMLKKSQCKERTHSTCNSEMVHANPVSYEKEMEHKLRLINLNNNPVSDVCLYDESSYQESENEPPLSDVCTLYSTASDAFHQVTSDLAVGIDSDEIPVGRDIRRVWRKKVTDPSPAYRLQFYAKRIWRYEQSDSNEISLSISAQTSVDADDSDTCPATAHNLRWQKCKIRRRPKRTHQVDDSTSEAGSHWSIMLQGDLKD